MQDLTTLREMDFSMPRCMQHATCMQALHVLHATGMQKALKKWLKNPLKSDFMPLACCMPN
jgi:hypothetical protein